MTEMFKLDQRRIAAFDQWDAARRRYNQQYNLDMVLVTSEDEHARCYESVTYERHIEWGEKEDERLERAERAESPRRIRIPG